MAVFSSKTKLKPCYDNDPYLRVKKDLEKLEIELKEGAMVYTVKTSL